MQNLESFLASASKKELEFVRSGIEKALAEKGFGPAARPLAGGALSVPEGTRRLSPEQLETATRSFEQWRSESGNPARQRSRNRIWLAFLLMRYGALRLGEVLALDDTTDILPDTCRVVVRGPNARDVLLPKTVMRQIAELLYSPMFADLRGQILHLDQGYLRRKFYERAKACGLPGKLFNPRVIRHSRAIELLGGGVPLQVAQSFLGQHNLNMTSNYQEFSGEAVQEIVKQYFAREGKLKTSARNSFTGKISAIKRDGLLAEVEITTLAGLQVVSVITEESFVNLRLAVGGIATALIKAPWVILAPMGQTVSASARNRFPGVIAEMTHTDVACEVVTELADGSKVCALLTLESARSMGLAVGDEVRVLFKAFSVILTVD